MPLPANCLPVQSLEDVTPTGARVRLLRVHTGFVPGTERVTVTAFDSPVPGTVVRVTAGWPTVAAFKTEVPLLHQAVALMATHYATMGRDLAITGAVAAINVVPEGYDALIAPHRLTWVA